MNITAPERALLTLSLCLASMLVMNPLNAQLDSQALRRAISGPDREVTDFVRDAVRKPVEVLEFVGIETGMSVLDLYAAGGYYTFILSRAVGPTGVVYAQNTARGLAFEEDRQDITQGEALELKIQQGNLANVTQIVRPLSEIGLPEASLDAIIVAQTLHDSYNPNPDRALNMLMQLGALLKPGGVIGITDHIGIAGRDNRAMHRMEVEQAIAVAGQAGFIVESSELLRSVNDDHSRSIFDPLLNRNTDRFLLRLTKP
ncbi:MAG: SAM-dependent methyltransferase [Proteobacteria bacterium]|nr:SAM-dependent methyltransferase [Pseudomonadota bacterium]